MGSTDPFAADFDGVAPAVFGADGSRDSEFEYEPEPPRTEPEPEPAPAREPAFVVPAEVVEPPQREVTVQLGRTEDDELVLLAFSTAEGLAASLGDEQPWVAIPKSELESVQRACGATFLEIDPVRPAD